MRRIRGIIAALIVLCALALAGCGAGGKGSAGPAAEPKTPEELYEQILKEAELPEMVLGDDEYIVNYYGIDPENLDGYVFATADSAILADAVIILKAKEEGSVEKLSEALRNIKEWKEAEMDNYAPDAYKVAKASSVRTEGKYVWLVMSEQSGKIEDIIRSGIGAK